MFQPSHDGRDNYRMSADAADPAGRRIVQIRADYCEEQPEMDSPACSGFVLPSKEEYIQVKIDPKVEVMGEDPLPARLKISWDTLTKASG